MELQTCIFQPSNSHGLQTCAPHTPYILGPHAPHMQDTQFSGTSLKVDKSPADISTVMLQCLLQGEDSE